MGAEARLAELKLVLPPAPKPVATYVTAIQQGDLIYVSGHGPLRSDGTLITGKLGADMDVAAGQAAARQTGLAILSTLRAHLGSLDKIERLIKSLGMVNSTPDFGEQPKVINGYSDLMKDVFGDAGVGTRSAVGTVALPAGIAVEIEAIFQVKRGVDRHRVGSSASTRFVLEPWSCHMLAGSMVHLSDRRRKWRHRLGLNPTIS